MNKLLTIGLIGGGIFLGLVYADVHAWNNSIAQMKPYKLKKKVKK